MPQNAYGMEEASKSLQKTARLAQSEGALVAAIKSDADGKRWLILALHDAKGDPVSIVKAPFDWKIEDERTATTVKRIGAIMLRATINAPGFESMIKTTWLISDRD